MDDNHNVGHREAGDRVQDRVPAAQEEARRRLEDVAAPYRQEARNLASRAAEVSPEEALRRAVDSAELPAEARAGAAEVAPRKFLLEVNPSTRMLASAS